MTERINLKELREKMERAAPLPYVVWDGCSWRRVASGVTQKTVIEPTNHPRDNHPDLIFKENDQQFVIAALNAFTLLLEIAEAAAEYKKHTKKKRQDTTVSKKRLFTLLENVYTGDGE